jgi:hypothetical protein
MIESIKKIAEIWRSLPVVPRRVALSLIGLSFTLFVGLRVWWVVQDANNLADLTFWKFIGF